MPHIYYAELIGLQRWKWRKKDYWMITDPRQGRLIDLLPVASDSGEWADHAEVLRTWVERAERRGTQRVLVGSLEWAEESEESPGVPGVPNPLAALYVLADRFTTVSLVHQALREVAWRYQQGLSVAARRSPERLRTRFLLLANPGRYRRLDDRIDQARLRARREALLGSTPILLLAAEMMAELRRVTTLDEDDDLMGSLSRWIDMVQALDLSDHPEPLEKSLYFAFQNAAAKLRQHVEAIEAGLALQAAEQVSLASSRRMIRSLNEFRASRQGDFEFLRRSALHVFGAPT